MICEIFGHKPYKYPREEDCINEIVLCLRCGKILLYKGDITKWKLR